jgi:hypothetical protein
LLSNYSSNVNFNNFKKEIAQEYWINEAIISFDLWNLKEFSKKIKKSLKR